MVISQRNIIHGCYHWFTNDFKSLEIICKHHKCSNRVINAQLLLTWFLLNIFLPISDSKFKTLIEIKTDLSLVSYINTCILN